MTLIVTMAVPHACQAQALSAGECIGEFKVAKLAADFDFCAATQAFALCIASVPTGDEESIKNAEAVLTEAQASSRINCGIKIAPSIKVVDREVRVTVFMIITA